MRTLRWIAPLAAALVLLSGCGYNEIQSKDEQVKAAWSEVLNQYQRRADLIPNLVATVQGYAAQERDVLIGVTQARARATSVNLTPEALNDPQAMQKFAQAQGELSSALGRLLVVAENYPQLKSDQNFRDLQAQLEGTENRIATARNRFIKATQDYNVYIRQFPQNLTAMMFGYKPKATFTVENEKALATPPKVDFAPKTAVPAAPSPNPAPGGAGTR
ncbi:MAG TPA: LemA family protein [Usitatibacter sp.]|jgi:LemA protein|nr:LemA family protein [Usitatibacter sp.]